MALNPDPPSRTMHDLWLSGVSVPDAYAQFARDHDQPIGIAGLFISTLQLVHSQFAIILAAEGGNADVQPLQNYVASNGRNGRPAIELKFGNGLVRQINAGNWIPIGHRIYASGRRELGFVWDGRLRMVNFDLRTGAYSGPRKRFEDVHILRREQCPDHWLQTFQRNRLELTGRPPIEQAAIAVERAAKRNPQFDDPRYRKRRINWVERELQQMIDASELNELISLSTIRRAIQQRRCDRN